MAKSSKPTKRRTKRKRAKAEPKRDAADQPIDWEFARNEYVQGSLSLQDISEAYGVSRPHLASVASDENWVGQRALFRRQLKHAAISEDFDTRRAILSQHISRVVALSFEHLEELGRKLADERAESTWTLREDEQFARAVALVDENLRRAIGAEEIPFERAGAGLPMAYLTKRSRFRDQPDPEEDEDEPAQLAEVSGG